MLIISLCDSNILYSVQNAYIYLYTYVFYFIFMEILYDLKSLLTWPLKLEKKKQFLFNFELLRSDCKSKSIFYNIGVIHFAHYFKDNTIITRVTKQ